MKKNKLFVLAGIGILVVISIVIFSKFFGGGTNFTSKSDSEILNYNYPTNDENAANYFINGDEFETYLIGGPYYMGNHILAGNGLDEYEELRQKKIEEAIDLTQETFENSKKLIETLEDYKGNLVGLWGVLLEQDPTIQEDKDILSQYLIEYKLQEDSLVLFYESIESENKLPAIQANMEYTKTVTAVELANILIEDMNYVMTYASVLFDTYSESENTNIQDAIKDFDKSMEGIENALDITRNLQENIDAINMALNQLEAGEYNIGMASISAIESKLPEIQSLIDNMSPKGNITQENIDFYKEYANFFQNYIDGYKSTMGEANPPEIPDTAYVPTPFLQEAEAGLGSYWDSAMGSLKSGAKTIVKGGATVVDKGLTRTGVKKKYQQAKKAIGLGLGSLNAATKSGFDMYFGRTNGLDRKEIGQSIMDNFKKFDEGVKGGTAGSEVLDTASSYLEGIDETGEALAGGAVQKLMGEGYTSKFAGWLGKSAGNLFTGFGQGVYKITNPKSNEGEIAEGVLDIGLSFIGGSKSIMKGSTILKGAKNNVKQISKSGLKYVSGLANGSTLKQAIGNSLKKSLGEGIEQTMSTMTKNLTAGFTNMMSAGWHQLGNKIPKTMNTAYKDFVKKQFKSSLGGYIKAVQGVIGSDPLDFLDNVVGNEVDGRIKGLVKEAINETINEGGDDEDEGGGEEDDSFIGAATIILYADYPPGAERGTVDYQGLIKYELFNTIDAIILKDGTYSFGNEMSFNVQGVQGCVGNSSINGTLIYDDEDETISGNFTYKWNGIVTSSDNKSEEKTVTYNCTFSPQQIPDEETMTVKTKGNITSTTILESGKPWTTENPGCPNLKFKVEWMEDEDE